MYGDYVIVCPSLNAQWAADAEISFDQKGDHDYFWLTVDNNQTNHGVAGAWNQGIDHMAWLDANWLVVCSESVRFGKNGKKDLEKALEHAHKKGWPAVEADDGLGWHLIAFSRRIIEKTGYFDEVFYPAYFEDNDFSYRYQRAYGITPEDYPLWPKVHIDCELIGIAQGLNHVREPIDMQGLQDRYVEKWGGVSPNETFEHPYNNPFLTYRYAQRIKR